MKSCTQCLREFADETLNFCLDDGARLRLTVGTAPATVVLRSKGPFDFDSFRLDVAEKVLLRDGEPVPLTPKCFSTLQMLVENSGHLLEKDKLLQAVWPDQFVEEGNLAYTVKLIRKALGDDADAPKYVQTVPRRGYRFVAEVRNGSLLSPEGGGSDLRVPSDNLLTGSRQGIYGPLIGRVKEIEEISELLTRNDVRLVTLTGIGGTGKTRLARETARQIKGQFSDGVFWVDLSSVVDPMMVAPTIGQALALQETARGILDVLEEYFRRRSILLVLDNFEQVVSTGVQLAQFLRNAGDLKILVTSREPLKLRAEIEYKVPPLAFPTPGVKETVSDLTRYEAVELFVQRAERARPDFELTESNASAISAICQKLDGLPLALELAASRTRVLSEQEILAKLENSLALLTGGSRDVPSRQQTMRATIEWSYGLLNELEKRIFVMLAVFEGGFTFKAAESVLTNASDNGPRPSEPEIVDVITSLTEKGLLLSQKSLGGELRFRMLIVVRDFALAMLDSRGETDELGQLHARYFLDLAERAAPELQSGRCSQWYERLEVEHDNLRAAMRWFLAREPDLAADLAESMQMFWRVLGYLREGQHCLEEVLRRPAEIPDALRWKLLTGLGIMNQLRGDFDAALEIYRTCLSESRAGGDLEQAARSLRGDAAIDYMRHDFESAVKRTNEACEITRAIGDEFGTGAAISRLADIALAVGDLDAAQVRADEALQIFRKLDYIYGVAAKLYTRGMAACLKGDFKAAREDLSEGLQISMEISDRQVIHTAFDGFAALFLNTGDFSNAARLSGFATGMAEDIDYQLETAEKLFHERYLERLQLSMAKLDFEAASAAGRKMSVKEAIDLALESTQDHEQDSADPDGSKP